MRKMKYLAMTLGATFAIFMATMVAYCGCMGPAYSPKMPANVDKLKKY